MSGRRRVTSYAVAEASGVSQATVSYVLNDVQNQTISEQTRKKVLDAAERLGYRPYGPARTLSLGRSSIALFVLPDFPIGHAMNALLDSLAARLSDIGRTLLTYRLPEGSPIAGVVSDIAPWAVISLMPIDTEQHELMRDQGVLLEIVDLGTPRQSSSSVLTNRQDGITALQVRHLRDSGHTRMGYALPADARLRPFAAPRLDGIEEALRREGLPAPVSATFDADPERSARVLAEWVASGVTAVAAYNDDVALAVVAGARRAAIPVPGRIAVIGVDDDPAGALVDPPLSTVHVDMAFLAARIVAHISGAELDTALPPNSTRLVVRGSG